MEPQGSTVSVTTSDPHYDGLRADVPTLPSDARRGAARAVNVIRTATYREIGRRVVQFEQGGQHKAGYGDELLQRLAVDRVARHGRGFGWRNLFSMRAFYRGWEIAIESGTARAGSTPR